MCALSKVTFTVHTAHILVIRQFFKLGWQTHSDASSSGVIISVYLYVDGELPNTHFLQNNEMQEAQTF